MPPMQRSSQLAAVAARAKAPSNKMAAAAVAVVIAAALGDGNELPGWSGEFETEVVGSGGFVVKVPMVMYGTAHKQDQTKSHTIDAIKLGYRGIDTANQPQHYDEAAVGAALASAYETEMLGRESFFLQSKFTPPLGHGDAGYPYDASAAYDAMVAESLSQSLAHLQTDYLDSYVLHEPTSSHDDMMAMWGAMETAYDSGAVKLLGISNVKSDHLERLLAEARVKPAFVQNRLQVTDNWDRAVRDICAAHGILYQGFSIIGSNRHLLMERSVANAAKWHGVTPAQVLMKWAVMEGVIALTSPRVHRHKNDNLELGFLLSTTEANLVTGLGHPDTGLKYTGKTKIEAKFWNELGEAVNVYWDDPAGSEVLSFQLPPGQGKDSAQVASTYHGHRFIIRNAAGHKMKEWVANAAKGEDQEVPINLQIATNFQSMHSEQLNVFWKSPDGSEVSNGALNPSVTGDSAGVQPIEVGTWHSHTFVCRDLAGNKVWEFTMDMSRGSFQVVTVPRPRGVRF